MQLSHFSTKPVSTVQSVNQNSVADQKPRGFWLSVDGDDDWPSWCQSEQWGLASLVVHHRVILHDAAPVLHLTSVPEIDRFHDQYGEIPEYQLGKSWAQKQIRWCRVAAEYQGIIISPYQWERRLDGPSHEWYYGWDCSSGCIWNSGAIRSIEVLADLRQAA